MTNNGPSRALAAVVTDTLPVIRQALYLSDTGGCTLSGRVLTCALGDLDVGQTGTFNVNMVVKGSRGLVTNTAVVASPTVDPNAADNTAVRAVTIGK